MLDRNSVDEDQLMRSGLGRSLVEVAQVLHIR